MANKALGSTALEQQFNNLYRRYHRQGIKDDAYTKTKERLDELFDYYYDREAPKSQVTRRNNEQFNEELADIMRDFIKDPEKMIDVQKTSKYKKFMQNHPEVKDKQGYIDYVESIKHGREAIMDLMNVSSDQVAEFYRIGRKKRVSRMEVDEIIEDTSRKYQGTNTDILAREIRKAIRRYK